MPRAPRNFCAGRTTGWFCNTLHTLPSFGDTRRGSASNVSNNLPQKQPTKQQQQTNFSSWKQYTHHSLPAQSPDFFGYHLFYSLPHSYQITIIIVIITAILLLLLFNKPSCYTRPTPSISQQQVKQQQQQQTIMANNAYGFDFLRADHKLDDDGHPLQNNDVRSMSFDDDLVDGSGMTVDLQSKFLSAQNKPDLEKQFDILAFLQAHRGSGCLAPPVIYKATGIDLDDNPKVADMLQRNPKVRVEMVPDPENPALLVATYAYQAKYANVRDRASLLAQINRMTSGGVPMRDLLDSYQTVEEDLQGLITAGDVIAVANTEDKDKILFPRGEFFLVELDGLVSLPPAAAKAAAAAAAHGSGTNKNMPPPAPPVYVVETDVDSRSQIRRGEAIQVGGQWFRVSSAVREGPLSEQPARAQAPLSVVSLTDLSKRNELVDGYIRPFTNKLLPLDGALSPAAQKNIAQAKAARERLLKLLAASGGAAHAGGHGSAAVLGRGSGSGAGHSGVSGQLTSSLAHASNPTTLAASMVAGSHAAAAASSSSTNSRKRPKFNSSHTSTSSSAGASAAANGASTAASRSDLEMAASDPALALYLHARRHGCTKDVRQMYLETRTLVPEADHDLHQLLLEHKLLEPGEQLRRPRLAKTSNVDNDGKPKKRRYYERKNQRMTNTHLEGTEIGAVLARAAEKQKQGKSVGDGGM